MISDDIILINLMILIMSVFNIMLVIYEVIKSKKKKNIYSLRRYRHVQGVY